MTDYRPSVDVTATRDDILRMIAPQIGSACAMVELAVACMGAAAVMIAMIPDPQRASLMKQLTDAFPASVAQRSAEIENGIFDAEFDGRTGNA